MLRWLFKLVVFLVLAALIYGLWLLYQEKTVEQKREIRSQIARSFQGAGRTLAGAARKVMEKGQGFLKGKAAEEASR